MVVAVSLFLNNYQLVRHSAIVVYLVVDTICHRGNDDVAHAV